MTCEACRTIPPVISEGYTPKGTYSEIAGLKTCRTLQGADLLAARLNAVVLVPDFFKGAAAQVDWLPPNTDEKVAALTAFMSSSASIPDAVSVLAKAVPEYRARFPSAKNWGAIGLCWGGKVTVLLSGADTPFAASGQVHPGRLEADDAKKLTIPHIVLASKDEPADLIKAYSEIIGSNQAGGHVETYETMWHGWMGARANLEGEESLAEYKRGYNQLRLSPHPCLSAMASSSSSPSVLLLGAGSVGAVYLHQLQRAGCSVTAVCRSNHDAVAQHGFTLRSPRFGSVTYRPDRIVRSPDDCPPDPAFDYVLVTTKAFPGSKPSLADQLRPVLAPHPSTAVVLAQNGIEIERELAEAFPSNPLLSAVIYLPTIQTSPGVIEHGEMLDHLELGTYPATAPPSHKRAAERFVELMVQGGGDATLFENIQEARWSKLLLNAAFNPVCALSLCTDGGFLATSAPFARDLVWGIMLEIVALARELGVAGVDEDAARRRIALAERRTVEGTGREVSMLQDVRMGRPFEVEAIVGNAVRLGRQRGVPMPRLETVYALAKGRFDALMGERV
ncbi:2-dehydropantoate 2-reductase [Aspergillus ellipticus CBS 707.79]|uniref:2-dehydropantoate 2-reductase n=1 Tax=Aspergillus ellipticus CBS 707.79 TaxID=1448320 RepID=A0A319DN63_9EURO|nr:2-dehydropantoate 2-reductase [Aspergillus ellipticus CBS 707.79]